MANADRRRRSPGRPPATTKASTRAVNRGILRLNTAAGTVLHAVNGATAWRLLQRWINGRPGISISFAGPLVISRTS